MFVVMQDFYVVVCDMCLDFLLCEVMWDVVIVVVDIDVVIDVYMVFLEGGDFVVMYG